MRCTEIVKKNPFATTSCHTINLFFESSLDNLLHQQCYNRLRLQSSAELTARLHSKFKNYRLSSHEFVLYEQCRPCQRGKTSVQIILSNSALAGPDLNFFQRPVSWTFLKPFNLFDPSPLKLQCGTLFGRDLGIAEKSEEQRSFSTRFPTWKHSRTVPPCQF